MIRVKFISICRGGSRRSSTSSTPSPPRRGERRNGWKFPPDAAVATGPIFLGRACPSSPRFAAGPCACTAGRGARDWLTDGWGNGRSDYWTRGSSTSKLRRIDRINLPPRRNIKAKGGGGGCLDGGGSNDSA